MNTRNPSLKCLSKIIEINYFNVKTSLNINGLATCEIFFYAGELLNVMGEMDADKLEPIGSREHTQTRMFNPADGYFFIGKRHHFVQPFAAFDDEVAGFFLAYF